MSHFQELLDKVAHFNCNPAVFKARVETTDNYTGYQAVATFRGGHNSPHCRSVQYSGETPEEAVFNLLVGLERFAPCKVCGEYPTNKS